MKLPSDPLLAVTTVALPILMSCAASGPPPEAPAPVAATVVADTVVQVDTVVVAAEPDPEVEARMARLEIMLLERDARISSLEASLNATRQEVVRNLAKLQSQASRAEAASGLAEAELAVQTLARTPGGEALSEHAVAVARLEESSREFAAENFAGALYLATQARSLAASGRTRLSARTDADLRPGEAVFATSVPLKTVQQRVNVRGGPGLEYGVLATLDPGTDVVGQSYTDEWVRAKLPDMAEGWIFHTLVTARR